MATEYKVSSRYASDIDITLQRVITPVIQRKIRRVVESITLLRRLYDINTLVYRAACDAWLEDFLDYCNLLDSSGVSAMIADYARFLLSEGFSFASAVQPGFIPPDSVPEARDFAKIIQDFAQILKEDWGVPDDKYNQFWPYIDQSIQRLYGSTPPMPVDQLLLIEPAVRRVFSMLDQEDTFEEWQHLKFHWKGFAQDSLLGLSGLAALGLAVPGGIVVAVGIVVPPIALFGSSALLLLAGYAVKAQ